MDLIYLDYNCFQRGFDDPTQVRIQMEALACQEIFSRAENGERQLIWSFMHEDENLLCPFPDRKYEMARLSALCQTRVGPEDEIRNLAQSFQRKAKLSAKDAIHLACAVHTGAAFFLTCDDGLIKRAKKLKLNIIVMNPVDYVRKEEDDESN
ncbi:MAG: type II toxin-antitoxin system VapC family toxin [Blastocatellia bacterium]